MKRLSSKASSRQQIMSADNGLLVCLLACDRLQGRLRDNVQPVQLLVNRSIYTLYSFQMSKNRRTQKRLDSILQIIFYTCSQSIVHFKFSWPILSVILTGTALLLACIKAQSISARHLRSPAQPQIFAE